MAKAAVCKTVIHRFESGCRLHQNDQGVAIQWVATPFHFHVHRDRESQGPSLSGSLTPKSYYFQGGEGALSATLKLGGSIRWFNVCLIKDLESATLVTKRRHTRSSPNRLYGFKIGRLSYDKKGK